MSIPKDLLYTESHEWVKLMDDNTARMGITDHAQEALGDLVYIELPQEGDTFEKGDNLAVVESVKATSDVFAPIAGEVSAVNAELEDEPGTVNENAYEAWFVEFKNVDGVELLSPEQYEALLKAEE